MHTFVLFVTGFSSTLFEAAISARCPDCINFNKIIITTCDTRTKTCRDMHKLLERIQSVLSLIRDNGFLQKTLYSNH